MGERLSPLIFSIAVVFGKVVEGMAVVKRIEAAGSKSGRTAQTVQVIECGELASRVQITARLEAEKVNPPPLGVHVSGE